MTPAATAAQVPQKDETEAEKPEEKAQIETKPEVPKITPMRDHKDKLASLDGLDCFRAEGKFCHTTGSTTSGYGVCCAPDYTGKNCNNNGLKCSQPALAADTVPKYQNVLTNGKNEQFFAFLPTSPYRCGISKNSLDYFEGSMRLNATLSRQQISLIGYKASLKFTEN